MFRLIKAKTSQKFARTKKEENIISGSVLMGRRRIKIQIQYSYQTMFLTTWNKWIRSSLSSFLAWQCFVTVWLPSSCPLKRLVASRHQKRVSSIKLYSTVAVMLENVTSIEDAASFFDIPRSAGAMQTEESRKITGFVFHDVSRERKILRAYQVSLSMGAFYCSGLYRLNNLICYIPHLCLLSGHRKLGDWRSK